MRLIDRLSVETEEFHGKADEDMFLLLGPVTPGDYRWFLARMYGFVAPVERSIGLVRGSFPAMSRSRRRTPKCYFGIIGESWKSYGDALKAVAQSEIKARRVLDRVRAAFRTWRSWRVAQDEHFVALPDGGNRERKPA